MNTRSNQDTTAIALRELATALTRRSDALSKAAEEWWSDDARTLDEAKADLVDDPNLPRGPVSDPLPVTREEYEAVWVAFVRAGIKKDATDMSGQEKRGLEAALLAHVGEYFIALAAARAERAKRLLDRKLSTLARHADRLKEVEACLVDGEHALRMGTKGSYSPSFH